MQTSPTRPRLTTDRLVLLPQTRAAATAMLAGEDAGLPLGAGYPHAGILDVWRFTVPSARSDADLGAWFITLAADGRVIGDCGTKGWVDGDGRVEIGYGLAAPFRNNGYGVEAVRALVDWLLDQPDVRAVTAEVEVGNIASRRLLERLGFTLEEEVDGCWWFSR